jgi:hypothetical protein
MEVMEIAAHYPTVLEDPHTSQEGTLEASACQWFGRIYNARARYEELFVHHSALVDVMDVYQVVGKGACVHCLVAFLALDGAGTPLVGGLVDLAHSVI